MKRMKRLMAALAVSCGIAGTVHAGIPSDALTVTIRPNAYYAVTISTDDALLDLGTVALAVTTQTVSPATVTIQSTYAQTDLVLQGFIESAGAGDWTFDASSASVVANEIAAWATFTSIARSSAPAQTGDYFDGTSPGTGNDMISGSPQYAGTSATNSTANMFEVSGEFDDKEMDAQAISSQSHLWLYFRMPLSAADNDPQNITILLTASLID